CDNCRKKKIKCDAKGDICSSCELLQIPCMYLDPSKKRGPPKGAGRYINAIEDRLHRMEAIVGGLIREDEPSGGSGEESGPRQTTFINSPYSTAPQPRSRPSEDHYEPSSVHFQPSQSMPYSQQQSNPEHHHHPPALHDFSMNSQYLGQQQHLQQQQAMLMQQPTQYVNNHQFFNQPPPVFSVQSNPSQSPASVTLSHTEDSPQSADSVRTSPLHRDLMRDSMGTSFDSPSPVMGSDHSVGDYHITSPATETLPKLGVNTPPIQEVDDLEDDMGHLTLDRGGNERYVGKSSPMFYMRRHWGGNGLHEAEKPAAKKFIENPDLPSPEVMTHLLNLHFTYVHPFAPVFVWSKFLKRLQSRDYTPSFLLLLNSIFALASRYSDDISFRTDPSKPETVGAQFSGKAKAILDTLYDEPDLYCVGALILLAFQQMGTGGSYRSWIYVGLSIRMAQHLGLNRDCLKLNPHMPALDREERNRIWWTVFMADRIISTSFGRPQGINEHDVDAKYPEGIDEDDTQLEYKLENATSMLSGPSPHSEKNFVFMASLMRILGRVMLSLYSPLSKASSLSTSSMTNPAPLEQLDKELTDWLLTLPPHLQFRSVQQEPGTFVCTLHMTFYAVLILLHRPYSHRSSHSSKNDPSISLSICTSAANNTIEMASNMMRAVDEKRGVSRLKGLLHNSVFIFFTAGLVHITNCTSTDPVLAASAKLRTIETLKCLSVVEDVWITGKWCGANIRQLLKARNIDLPPIDGFKQLPLGTIHDFVLSKSNSSSQMDLSLAASIPKEQSFAFDVDQIMGYYQGTGTKHTEPVGRNSRHFSPTPYFSTSSHHHHHGSQMKSHPGLTQGHAPLPRRPRQGKNTSPTPNTTFSTVSTLVPAQPSLFPSNQDGTDSGYYSTPLIDPFATPGSASVGGTDSQSHPSPTSSEGSVNMYQNPFSSSLWGLPTSLDNDEWMLYMQSGGGGAGTNGAGNNQLSMNMKPDVLGQKSASAMFDPMSDLNSTSLFDQGNLGLSDNTSRPSRMHPLAQSLTRNDLMGENGMEPKGQNNTSVAETSQPMNVDVFSPTANKLPTTSNSSPNQSLMASQPQTQDYDFLLGSMGSMGNMSNMSLSQQIPQ
ncbi:hypothetical protein BG003_007700, partial [Podila horticola]